MVKNQGLVSNSVKIYRICNFYTLSPWWKGWSVYFNNEDVKVPNSNSLNFKGSKCNFSKKKIRRLFLQKIFFSKWSDKGKWFGFLSFLILSNSRSGCNEIDSTNRIHRRISNPNLKASRSRLNRILIPSKFEPILCRDLFHSV